MAASQGYQYEFMDSVFDDLYCKRCTLVARRLTVATCCGESFCHGCIADIQEEGKPCPLCDEKDFTVFEQVRSQRRINCLQVYCSMKERGCDWSGTLEQMDTHLDPDRDNCQYVDTKCPLNCHMTIPKNKVEQHVAQHCTKRPYVCQHCNFKATYEEVVDEHLPECKYVPLQCPNLCGVTFERDFMEDHMKMCRLEEVGCEFSGVGCDHRFRREDQEEHTRQNSQKHLTLTASLAVEAKEQLQQKLLEQVKEHREEEESLKRKAEEQEKKLEEQEKKLEEQEKKLQSQERKLRELGKEIEEQKQKLIAQDNTREKAEQKMKMMEEQNKVQKQKLAEQKQLLEHLNLMIQKLGDVVKEVVDKSIENDWTVSKLLSMTGLNPRFEMKNFTREKDKDKPGVWKSPALHTHVSGYRFCIGVDANGFNDGRGCSIHVDLWSMPGEFDDHLKWPASAKITIELVNHLGRENASYSQIWNWEKPTKKYSWFGECERFRGGFLEHYNLQNFLSNDTLFFNVSEIVVFLS